MISAEVRLGSNTNGQSRGVGIPRRESKLLGSRGTGECRTQIDRVADLQSTSGLKEFWTASLFFRFRVSRLLLMHFV